MAEDRSQWVDTAAIGALETGWHILDLPFKMLLKTHPTLIMFTIPGFFVSLGYVVFP